MISKFLCFCLGKNLQFAQIVFVHKCLSIIRKFCLNIHMILSHGKTIQNKIVFENFDSMAMQQDEMNMK